jgi:polysaccharide biosynthesis protein PslE
MPYNSHANTTTLHMVSRAVWRHKGKVLLWFVAVMAGVFVYNALSPAKYRSEAKLLVRMGRENAVLDPTVTLGHEQLLSVPQLRENEINTVVEVLGSRPLAEHIVDAMGPEKILGTQPAEASAADDPASPALRDDAIAALSKNLEVSRVSRSDVVRLGYLGLSPELSRDVLDRLVDEFLREHLRLNRPAGARDFFEEQTGRVRGELDRTEQSLRKLKSETGIVAVEGQRETVVKRIGQLQIDLAAAAAELAVADSASEHLRQKLDVLPKTTIASQTSGVGNDGTDRMRERFYGLRVIEEEAKAKYAEAHPRMQQLHENVAAAQQTLDQEERTRTQVTTTPDKSREQALLLLLSHETAAASARAKTQSLQTQLAVARDELKAFNDVEIQIARLQRDKEIQDANYRKYAAVLEEARIDKAQEMQRMSNVAVVQPPTSELRPARPRKLLNLLAGLAAGILGGVALAVSCEHLGRAPATGSGREQVVQASAPAAQRIADKSTVPSQR